MNDQPPLDSTRSVPLEPGTRTNATLVPPPDEQVRRAAAAAGASVPGFEIEGTLGRGAFGVVYRAKQLGLNRAVALKMLLAGPFAGPAARARFLIEAESVAALEHPGIVRVFQVGEHAEHPFLAMEFVPGGTLADRVRVGGPLPPADAARVVAKLAEAVAHAHSRGVVHRDIKPGNILLTPDGEPRLTDFGLAKVGRSDMTVTGQILGTPAYMSPEQAAGKTNEVGTAADVYALGAVLYDALVGRPPFLGGSAAVTLQKVIADEPERPRQLVPSVSRDLETICLKCLEKEPSRRYATAQALADDLRRYLNGEAIGARAAGSLERGYRWVRRNKVVAGAVTAVFLALLVGAGVSTYGLLEARRQKRDAEDAAAREEDEKNKAIAARDELAKKSDELRHERERANRALANALLAPITTEDEHLSEKELTPYEIATFVQIARLRRDEVAFFFLEEATQTSLSCEQLAHRAEHGLHAALGLDAARRDAMIRILFARMRADPKAELSVSSALVASRWSGLSTALAAESSDVLDDALRRETSTRVRRVLARGLAAVTVRLDAARAADRLAAALDKETDRDARKELAGGLSEIGARLDAARAAKVANSLVVVLRSETDAGACLVFAKSLSVVAGRLDTAAARAMCAAAADHLTAALDKEKASHERVDLAEGLSVVVTWLEPDRAGNAVASIAAALVREEDDSYRSTLAECLVAAIERADSVLAADVRAAAVAALASSLDKKSGPAVRRGLELCLPPLAARLSTARSAEACAAVADRLTTALGKETDGKVRLDLARNLLFVVMRFPPAFATKVADDLAGARDREQDGAVRDELASVLSIVATRMMDPARAADLLTAALDKETRREARLNMTWGLAVVTLRLDDARVAKLADSLVAALDGETDSDRRVRLANCLEVLVPRLDPGRTAKVSDGLVAALERETGPSHRASLAGCLPAAAARLNPARSAELRKAAADRLTESLYHEPDRDTRERLVHGMLSVSFCLRFDSHYAQHASALVGVFVTPHNFTPSLSLLYQQFQLQPQPLPYPPQRLVELLKHPLCVGRERRVVLNALEFTYNRPFKDQWEFVEYAQKHQPQLDLLTPPTSPEPKP